MHDFAVAFRPPAPVPLERPLGLFALMKALRTNALECWTKAHFEEPIVLGGFPFAPVAVVSDPVAVRQVLVEDQSTYRKSALEQRILSARLRNGLVAVDGDQWGRLRRTLAPMFARKTVLGFAPTMASTVVDLIERWHHLPAPGIIEIKTEMLRLALEALVRCIFADGIGDPEAVCAATTRYYSTCGTLDPFDVIGLPEFVPRLTRLRERGALRDFDEGLSAAIIERRRNLDVRPGAPRDMLGAMLIAEDPETGKAMTQAEVKDNVLTFIFGGQETTSSTLTWAVYLLSQSAEWRERVIKEADHIAGAPWEDAVGALVETRAVIDEALRLYPPIIAVTRSAVRRTEIAGHPIERGTLIVVSPYVLHRHRLLWRDPDVFDPARFLPLASRKIERYSYLPFGVGPRMCVAASFALQEATLALAMIMRHFVLEPTPNQSVWPAQRQFTMKPRDGLRMTATPRARVAPGSTA